MPKVIEIWVPHRISGFFQMIDPKISKIITNPLEIGSRGGGPALNAFIKTKIELIAANKANNSEYIQFSSIKYQIFINGSEKSKDALTSSNVIELMSDLIKEKLNENILKVSHEIDLPMGCGYGSSGGGALGIAIGINLLLNLGLSSMNCAKYAHIAEVNNHTGLGTVGGQLSGGFSLSINPGWPFDMDHIPFDENLRVIIISFGQVSTKSILIDPTYKSLIHQIGTLTMEKMHKHFSTQNFLDCCKYFIQQTKLIEKLDLNELNEIIDELYKFWNTKRSSEESKISYPFGASLNQLGKSIFCICEKKWENEIIKLLKKYNPEFGPISLKVNQTGPIIKEIIIL